MTKEEKIKKIVEAVNAGMPKIRIDRSTHGSSVRKLQRNERVTERKVSEIYDNLVFEQQNHQSSQDRLKQYRDYCPDVPKETKVKELIRAVERDKVPKYRLDRAGTGNAMRDLISGRKTVGICKINEMYAALQTILGEKKKSRKTKKKSSSIAPSLKEKGTTKSENGLDSKLQEQEKQISYLLNKVSFLEDKIAELGKALSQQQNKIPSKVNGITITQKVDVVKGKKYKRWYGIYRENNKQRWIYIGKDKSKAEEKIGAWLKKNGKGDRK